MRAKMKEREGASGQRRERTKRGAAETKRRSCRVEHRDVTELIIGFCRDLARAAFFFFFCRRAHLYLFSVPPSVFRSERTSRV